MEKSIKKPIIILFFVQFMVMVGFGIVIPILPFLVKHLNGSEFSLGFFMAAFSITQFLFAPFWGRMSDRIGRRPVMIIGIAGYGLSYFLFALAENMVILIAIRALSGVISSATLPTAFAYLADITPEGPERSKAMGMIGAAMGLGMIFGPALGGWLGHDNFIFPFFVAGGLSLAIVPFAWFMLSESLQQQAASTVAKRPKLSVAVIRDPLFILFAFNFIMTFGIAMFEATFAWLANAKLGFGPSDIAVVFVLAGVSGVIVQGMLIGKLVRKFGDGRLVIAGTITCAVGLILIILSASRGTIMASTVVFMIGTSLMGPTSSSLVSKHAENKQGEALGLFQAFGSLGRIFGPITGGILYSIAIGMPYVAGAIIMLVMLFFAGKKIYAYQMDAAL